MDLNSTHTHMHKTKEDREFVNQKRGDGSPEGWWNEYYKSTSHRILKRSNKNKSREIIFMNFKYFNVCVNMMLF